MPISKSAVSRVVTAEGEMVQRLPQTVPFCAIFTTGSGRLFTGSPVRARVREKWRSTANSRGQGGSTRPAFTIVRSGRPAGCDLAPTAPGTAKWRFGPSKNRHLAPFSSTFWTIFSEFFHELAYQGANWRNSAPKSAGLEPFRIAGRHGARERTCLNSSRDNIIPYFKSVADPWPRSV